ncbi:MAG: hypothetical protein WCC87_04220 [Candidatus Korobacteraceae bacterium]
MSQPSSTHSPFRDGFAALLHEPVLLPAELAWRWCFGLSALGLGILSIALFLDSLKLTRADEFLIRTWQPQLLDSALRHILRGSLTRFLVEQTVLILGITLLWSGSAAAGRAATLRRLVAMFSTDEDARPMEWNFAPIFTLQLLRAMWSLIAVAVALVALVYGLVMVQNEHPLRAALALSFGVGLASCIGVVLNWYFGVAPLFCVRNGASGMEAFEQSIEFSSRRAGRLFLLGLGFLAMRLIWGGTMMFAFLSPLNLADSIGPRWTLGLMGVVAVVYCAGADVLYLARLGAYASLAEEDARPVAEVIAPEIIAPAEIVPPPDLEPTLGLA